MMIERMLRAHKVPYRLGRDAAVAIILSALLAMSARAETQDGPVPDLPEVVSHQGILQTTLEAADQEIILDQAHFPGASYNHNYAGPVLRVHPGDTMKIRLINHLKHPTNLHFHGIETSPEGNGDNIHVAVTPGNYFDYLIKVPTNQTPGTYWYHDHFHGITEKNVMQGLSGALIVEGFADQFPELKNVREHLFVLKDYEFETSDDPYIVKIMHKFIQSINGKLFTQITMRPGETQLWHLSNQSADYYFDLALKDHNFRLIGEDGTAAQKISTLDTIKIKPASRFEILVDAGKPGTYDLISEGVVTGEGATKTPDRVLGQVIVAGEPMTPVTTLAAFPFQQDLSAMKITTARTIIFTQSKSNEEYFINGRKFDHNRIDTRVPLGSLEEWTIRNDSDELHVFHIHQLSFQVTAINGVAQTFNGYVDNVRVPERGSVTLRMAFTNPTMIGQFVYHCHVLLHEDKGMMAQIEVYDPKESWLHKFWREMFFCCSAMKFNGGCFWSNIQLFFLTHFQKNSNNP